MKKLLTNNFFVSIERRGQEKRTEDDDHERRATEDCGMEGDREDRAEEEGDAG